MKQISHNVPMSSSEIANLWTQYMNDSMGAAVTSYFIKTVDDPDIKEILEFALSLSKGHLSKIREFLKKENFPIPKGFTKLDVNYDAPPLFTDTFMLVYYHVMTLHGLTGYAGAVGTSARADQRKYFISCNKEAMELYDRIMDVMLSKGIFSRPPHIAPKEKIDFVEKQSFLTGFLGNRRPLNAIEISGIYYNMHKNIVKIVLELGFTQVTETDEVRAYFQRGHKVCDKQFDILNTMLTDDNLPPPRRVDSEITNSTVAPFSEKLMLFHVVTLVSAAVGFYGAGFAVAQRRDLAAQYARLITEIALYAEDGINLLIEKGWIEEPPSVSDRDKLADTHNN
ncbi:DUF3231 family protein [Bacillus sp. BGMRC 2118]|nr:DUF3231 family protein [Bacillus sp. BGMRC 2118]